MRSVHVSTPYPCCGAVNHVPYSDIFRKRRLMCHVHVSHHQIIIFFWQTYIYRVGRKDIDMLLSTYLRAGTEVRSTQIDVKLSYPAGDRARWNEAIRQQRRRWMWWARERARSADEGRAGGRIKRTLICRGWCVALDG